jgi:Protein of unknown function (DUF2442)
MSTSAKAVRFDADSMWVELSDGRVIAVPLAWFPRLMRATAAQRAAVEISPRGLHWDGLDEDVSIDGLLAGNRDMTQGRVAAN